VRSTDPVIPAGPRFRADGRAMARAWLFVAIAAAMILAVHVGVFVRDGLYADRILQDTDAYMWLVRAERLWETGDWFEHTYPRVNPPDGHAQHWTRPFDAVLVAGGAALGTVVGFERGVYYWALALTPLLHVLALMTLVWAVGPLVRRGLLPPGGLPILLLVFVAQVGAYQPFLMGRPDHHAPMALLFIAWLGFLMRLLLDRRHGVRSAIGLGLVSALAVWVLVEALVFVVIGMLGLGLAWLFGNDRLGRLNALHGAALFAGIAVAWLLEWGPGALAARHVDMLSSTHVVLFGFTALFWAGLWWAGEYAGVRRAGSRAAVAGVGAVLALGATFAFFPAFLGSPFGQVDPLVADVWLFSIDELQPLLASAGDLPSILGRLALFAGIALAAVPWLAARALRPGDPDERVLWLVFVLALLVFLALTLQQRRWTDYLALSAVIPFTLLTGTVLDHLARRLGGWRLRTVRPLALAGMVVGPVLLAVVLGTGFQATDTAARTARSLWAAVPPEAAEIPAPAAGPARRSCDLARIGALLADTTWFPQAGLVLAHADHGPELLYRTPHGVLSITNHRPQPGFTFTWDVLTSDSHNAAAATLRKRGVDAIVLCARDLGTGFAPMLEARGSLLRHLAAGGIPEGYVLHAATPHWRAYRRLP
jgi:hypothetical protein